MIQREEKNKTKRQGSGETQEIVGIKNVKRTECFKKEGVVNTISWCWELRTRCMNGGWQEGHVVTALSGKKWVNKSWYIHEIGYNKAFEIHGLHVWSGKYWKKNVTCAVRQYSWFFF